MPVYKFVSSKEVIAATIRRFGLKSSESVVKAIESIGEGLLLMGSPNSYVTTSSMVTVSEYKGKLPCNLKLVMAMQHNNFRLPRNNGDDMGINYSEINELDIEKGEWYYLNGNYFQTSFESGEVRVYYKAIAVDCDGFPLVPDNQKVKEALTWRINMDILSTGEKHPVFTFKDAESRWEIHMQRGRNSMNIMDVDDMERFKEMWVGIVPDPDLGRRMFNTIIEQ